MRILITNVPPKFDNNVPAPLLFPCQQLIDQQLTQKHTQIFTSTASNTARGPWPPTPHTPVPTRVAKFAKPSTYPPGLRARFMDGGCAVCGSFGVPSRVLT